MGFVDAESERWGMEDVAIGFVVAGGWGAGLAGSARHHGLLSKMFPRFWAVWHGDDKACGGFMASLDLLWRGWDVVLENRRVRRLASLS